MKLKEMTPIVVGGCAGSGTRVPMMALKALGVNVNSRGGTFDSGLAQGCWALAQKVVQRPDEITKEDFVKWLKDRIIEKFCCEDPWGWKNPPNIILYPMMQQLVLPNMKFVHVVRDPRMINKPYMKNWLNKCNGGPQVKKRKYNHYYELWCDLNLKAKDHGEKVGNYIAVRMEDLIFRTGDATKRLAEFIGVPFEIKNQEVYSKIKLPVSMNNTSGRFKNAEELMEDHRPIVKEFGYEESERR